MLHVSSGHERGIGLEVFLKAFICLPAKLQKKINLHVSSETLEETLGFCKLPKFKNLTITNVAPSKDASTETLVTLLSALSAIKKGDVLFTLPTSKDQLSFKGKQHLGYTEFLRAHFNEPRLPMTFRAPNCQIALLSDHVSLKNFVDGFNKGDNFQKLSFLLEKAVPYYNAKEVFIAGVNPHAGEGGLLGNEDTILETELAKIAKFKITGPLPADTMYMKASEDALLVFLYHDQGLSWFKGTFGLLGANITLGLPFTRLSVDHGTAFDLYGKNVADYRGCLYALKLGLKESL